MLLGFTQVAELRESDSRWELKSNIQVLSHSEDSRWELKSNIQVLLGYCENIQLMVSHLAFTSITSGWLQLWLWVDNPLQCCKGLDQPGHIYELWNTLTLSTQKNVSIRVPVPGALPTMRWPTMKNILRRGSVIIRYLHSMFPRPCVFSFITQMQEIGTINCLSTYYIL